MSICVSVFLALSTCVWACVNLCLCVFVCGCVSVCECVCDFVLLTHQLDADQDENDIEDAENWQAS